MDLHRINYQVDFGNAVDQAIADGADIISASIGWFIDGPGDGTGLLASIVQNARQNGIFFATSAGNSAEHSWSGTFTPESADPETVHLYAPGQNINGFGPPGSYWVLPAGVPLRVGLHWDDWTVVNQDYDLILVGNRGAGWELVESSAYWQDGSPGQTPIEFISTTTLFEGAYGLVVARWDSTRNVCFRLIASHAGPELNTRVAQRSITFPADSPDAITVGAVDVSSFLLEEYSSQGPTFGPGGTCTGGSIKPDIASYANVSTVSYGAGIFNGTSAAAPHVAGAAALARQAYPNYTVAQVQQFLETNAIDLGTAGKDTLFGAGRLFLGPPAECDIGGLSPGIPALLLDEQ